MNIEQEMLFDKFLFDFLEKEELPCCYVFYD